RPRRLGYAVGRRCGAQPGGTCVLLHAAPAQRSARGAGRVGGRLPPPRAGSARAPQADPRRLPRLRRTPSSGDRALWTLPPPEQNTRSPDHERGSRLPARGRRTLRELSFGCARIERELALHLLVECARLRRIRWRQDYFQLHELIAWWVARQTAPAQTQLLPRLRTRRNPHLHRSAKRRHGNGCAERRLPRRDGQRHSDVALVELILAVRPYVHLEEKVTRGAAGRRGFALTGEPQLLPITDARRNVHLHGVFAELQCAIVGELRTLQLERAAAAPKGLFEIDVDARVMVPALAWRATTRARAAEALERTAATADTPASAEQRGEEVAEIEVAFTAAAARAAAKLEAAAEIRRRAELLARLPVAAELVVRGALLGVLQYLVRFLHFLELRLGVLLLAHIRVVLPGEAPVGLLDLVGGGRARHIERLVVVPVFHE